MQVVILRQESTSAIGRGAAVTGSIDQQSYDSVRRYTVVLTAICASTYAIELLRSAHGYVVLHELLSTFMGVYCLAFGLMQFWRSLGAKNRATSSLYEFVLAYGMVILGFALTTHMVSTSALSSLIVAILFLALYVCKLLRLHVVMARTQFREIHQKRLVWAEAIVMSGMMLAMVLFYATLHLTVISLIHFRVMR